MSSSKIVKPQVQFGERPSREMAEQAVRTLIAFAGDDPKRPGVLDTPGRVTRAFEEFYSGYAADAHKELSRTFDEIEGYDDVVLLRGIRFESHCEHHMMPFIGYAHVAYKPDQRVVGISKLARVVDIFAKRLQSQETMTVQIADAIQNALQPKGVAVIIEAEHFCMTMRGVGKAGVMTRTNHYLGEYRDNPETRRDLLASLSLS